MPSLPEKIEGTERAEKLWRLTRAEEALKRAGVRRAESIRKSMRRPLRREILRVFFITFCIIVDGLIPLEFIALQRTPLGLMATLASLVALLISQGSAYGSIWGKKGCWSIETEKIKV